MLLDLHCGNQPLKACLLYMEGNGGIQQVDLHMHFHCLVCFLHSFYSYPSWLWWDVGFSLVRLAAFSLWGAEVQWERESKRKRERERSSSRQHKHFCLPASSGGTRQMAAKRRRTPINMWLSWWNRVNKSLAQAGQCGPLTLRHLPRKARHTINMVINGITNPATGGQWWLGAVCDGQVVDPRWSLKFQLRSISRRSKQMEPDLLPVML